MTFGLEALLTDIDPTLVEVGPSLADCSRIWPLLHVPSVEAGPALVDLGPDLAEVGQHQ